VQFGSVKTQKWVARGHATVSHLFQDDGLRFKSDRSQNQAWPAAKFFITNYNGINMQDIKLPSGATLKITLSPFAVSKALLEAVSAEAKDMRLDPQAEIDLDLMKNLFCTGFSSKKIDAALQECTKRCTYNGVKLTEDTFEPEDARQDYVTVCLEVALANLRPFTKNLFAELNRIAEKLANSPK